MCHLFLWVTGNAGMQTHVLNVLFNSVHVHHNSENQSRDGRERKQERQKVAG